MQFGKRPGDENFITGQVPGGDAMILDNNVAFKIPAGSVLMLQIHYVTTGQETTDQISVGIKFAREVVHKNLQHAIVHTGDFAITPGDPHHLVKARKTLDCNATGYGMMTHMHLRGKDMTYRAIYPDGRDEMLLAVPNYSFDWQMAYRWPEDKIKFPKGTEAGVYRPLRQFDLQSVQPRPQGEGEGRAANVPGNDVRLRLLHRRRREPESAHRSEDGLRSRAEGR